MRHSNMQGQLDKLHSLLGPVPRPPVGRQCRTPQQQAASAALTEWQYPRLLRNFPACPWLIVAFREAAVAASAAAVRSSVLRSTAARRYIRSGIQWVIPSRAEVRCSPCAVEPPAQPSATWEQGTTAKKLTVCVPLEPSAIADCCAGAVKHICMQWRSGADDIWSQCGLAVPAVSS